ncbi:MAG: hypothetical protein M3Y86_01475 [Verrucomicrobiota bacterium]|nr:hypothetical protein [Verrucomicrobiota bacterium]
MPDSPEQDRPARRRTLTPEQRRLLGTPRASDKVERPAPAPPPPIARTLRPEPAPREEQKREHRPRGADVRAQTKAAQTVELRTALLIISGLVFLGLMFYVGRRFDSWKYLISTRVNAHSLESEPDKFPSLSAEELIRTALAAEKRGDWTDAAARLMAAKRKNLALPGIFFHLGKTSFDRGDLNNADNAFARALQFNENVAAANYYRGLIALKRRELQSAIGFFEAAAAAEPFVPDMFYFWAEALRLDGHPVEAIRRYEQAIARATRPDDIALYQGKIRFAEIEAAQATKVSAELEQTRQAGPLPVEWLMVEAALQLHAGKIPEAAESIRAARERDMPALFLACSGDEIFRKAAETHPEIAAALRADATTR